MALDYYQQRLRTERELRETEARRREAEERLIAQERASQRLREQMSYEYKAAEQARAEQQKQAQEYAERLAAIKKVRDYMIDTEVRPEWRPAVRQSTVVVGMNKLEVQLAWGEPPTVRRTVWQEHECDQYVYPNGVITLLNNEVVLAEQLTRNQ